MIVKIRTVKSNLEDVWWKWTTREGLLTFFGPDNNVELRLGGPFEIYFLLDNPKGLRGSEGCKIISYLPKKMLSFTWNAPPQYPEIRNHEHKTWVVVIFDSITADKTKVTLHHLGWLEGKQWDAVYDYFNLAWDTVLDWLEQSCEK
ncbi:SRPBCC family protein [Flagellimonas sp.]|uniref:SRPBCC family protein n=1 Tax=Flagellimonas sp. TaxID=2058762 RepID=UPI003B5117B7